MAKRESINATVMGSVSTRRNELFNILISFFFGNKTKRDVQVRYSMSRKFGGMERRRVIG